MNSVPICPNGIRDWYTLPFTERGQDYTINFTSSTEVEIHGLTNGDTYIHKVRSLNSDGTSSAYSVWHYTTLPGNTPTPASTLTATPTACIQQLSSYSQQFSVSRTNQSWHSGCVSARTGYTYYAQYYSFTLSKASFITIDLDGNVDSEIFLREGTGPLNILLLAHDEGGYPDGQPGMGQDSRVGTKLSSGTYTIEAATRNPQTAGNFTLKIHGEKPIPSMGHQRDYTIKYVVGTMPPTWTPTPTPISYYPYVATPIPTPQDPGVIIPTISIPTAVAAWNIAVATPISATPAAASSVFFCGSDVPCGNKNTDNKKTIINAVNGARGWQRSLPLPLAAPFGHCGNTLACVVPDPFFALWYLSVGMHMGNLKMLIEEPAWRRSSGGTHIRVIWTDNHSLDGVSTGENNEEYRYLPSVVMHEFGHTAGLQDLYKYTGYDDYLMDFTYQATAIPQEDIDYIRQVYRDGHSEPH